MEKIDEELKVEKPEVLYRGSSHGDIAKLEPQAHSRRGHKEGEIIFATQDLALAAIFMSGSGHVYVLPSDIFSSDPSKGLGIYEWTSKEKVKPIQKIESKSSLDAIERDSR